MQKCTLLSWGLRLPSTTVMCSCYDRLRNLQVPFHRTHAFIWVLASQGLHCASLRLLALCRLKLTLPHCGQPQMLTSMSVLSPAQHHSRYTAFLYRSGQPSARSICLCKVSMHEPSELRGLQITKVARILEL